jgi:hypothetical protein
LALPQDELLLALPNRRITYGTLEVTPEILEASAEGPNDWLEPEPIHMVNYALDEINKALHDRGGHHWIQDPLSPLFTCTICKQTMSTYLSQEQMIEGLASPCLLNPNRPETEEEEAKRTAKPRFHRTMDLED